MTRTTRVPARQDLTSTSRSRTMTVPTAIVGSIALSLTATPAMAQEKPAERPLVRPGTVPVVPVTVTAHRARSSVLTAPSYTVRAGDTVTSIAIRHKLQTSDVLAWNGLGWQSLIFPGQVLRLSAPGASAPKATAPKPAPKPSAPAKKPSGGTRAAKVYTIVSGDTISGIAGRHGVSTASVLTANGLRMSSIIYPGQKIRIPGAGTPAPSTPKPSTPAAKPSKPAPSGGASKPATPQPSKPSTPQGGSYTIVAGDTMSAIAARHGVSTQRLLDANGLGWGSIIYPGQKIAIPGSSSSATPPPAPKPSAPAPQPGTGESASGGSSSTQKFATLNETQAANARLIVRVGQELGVPDRGIQIALATAMVESSMYNLDYGDRDSAGLFQQRPSQGWGTEEQVQDAERAALAFYGGPRNPNKGKTRGLLDIPGWQSMGFSEAAQAVQISAFPDAYGRWEVQAKAWFAQYR